MFKKMSDIRECCDTKLAWMCNDKSSRGMKKKGQNSKQFRKQKGIPDHGNWEKWRLKEGENNNRMVNEMT